MFASLKSSFACRDVSRLVAGALTVCRARSFAEPSAGLEAEADELRAAVEDSGLSDFFLHSSPPFLGNAFALIGVTGLAICEEDSLSEELISTCLSPFTSRFLFSLRVSDRTSLRIPCLKRSAMVRSISSTRSFSRVWEDHESGHWASVHHVVAWPRYRRVPFGSC